MESAPRERPRRKPGGEVSRAGAITRARECALDLWRAEVRVVVSWKLEGGRNGGGGRI